MKGEVTSPSPPPQLLSEKSEPVKGADCLTQQLFLTIHSSAVLSLRSTPNKGQETFLNFEEGSRFCIGRKSSRF